MKEKYVLHGVKPELPIPQENTGKFIYESIRTQDKTEVVFINDETGEKLTYGGLLENSCRLSQSFCLSRVIFDKKVIAICSENHVNYLTIVLGSLYVGVPIVFLNPKYTEYEFQHALNVTKPDMIFCTGSHLSKFVKLKSKNHFIRNIVTIDSTKTTKDSDSFQTFIDRYTDKELNSIGFRIREVDIYNHPAFILFSSGTTGLPKGVVLTHLSVNATLSTILGPNMENRYDSDVTLGVLPFFHIFGLQVSIISLLRKRKVVVLDRFEPELYLKNVEKYKIATLITVPPLVQFLLKNEIVNNYDLSSVKEIICGAAPLGKDLSEAIRKKLNLKIVRNGYGMTESGLSITFSPLDVQRQRPGSVGPLFPGLSGVIKDADTGENLGPNQKGEICIRGPTIMKEYYGNEKATQETFTKDGWMRTGDIGYVDEDGFIYVVDRMKELIKYKGFQVAPAELEQLLVSHPGIQDAGVIGIPDANAGELPLAFVVKQPNVSLTEEEIKEYLSRYVSRNKQLHGGVIFMDAIPRNPSGKIIRKDLKMLLTTMKSKL